MKLVILLCCLLTILIFLFALIFIVYQLYWRIKIIKNSYQGFVTFNVSRSFREDAIHGECVDYTVTSLMAVACAAGILVVSACGVALGLVTGTCLLTTLLYIIRRSVS